MANWTDTPLTRGAAAALPLLIEAHDKLYGVAAPQASRIADRIGALLAELIEVAGDVEAYGNKWTGGDIGELASPRDSRIQQHLRGMTMITYRIAMARGSRRWRQVDESSRARYLERR